MVAWTTPPTFASPWNISDPNTYIRDNELSCRYPQSSPVYLVSILNVTSTPTDLYTSSNLLPAALGEITNLQVLVWAQYVSTLSGSPTAMAWRIKDQGGTTLGVSAVGWLNATKHCVQNGQGNVASGTNPSFKINANTDTGSASWLFLMAAWVKPTTT